MSQNRVFVSNVSFDCSSEDFFNKFKLLDGFVDAKLYRRYKSSLSKGFGYVEFNNKSYADKLLNSSDMTLNDRPLKFSEYNKSEDVAVKFKAVANNLDPFWNLENVTDLLKDFDVTVSFRNKYNGNGIAILVFNDQNQFNKALESNFTLDNHSFKIESTKRNREKYNQPKFMEDYDNGFKAGYKAGLSLANHKGSYHDDNRGHASRGRAGRGRPPTQWNHNRGRNDVS